MRRLLTLAFAVLLALCPLLASCETLVEVGEARVHVKPPARGTMAEDTGENGAENASIPNGFTLEE